VIFDFISARLPYYNEAKRLFILAEQGLIDVVTLPHLVINVWQIRGHMKIKNQAMYSSLGQLLTVIQILDEPSTAITNAIMVKSSDFEDWVTVECAMIHDLDSIITRNAKHFKRSPVSVYTPTDFIRNFSFR